MQFLFPVFLWALAALAIPVIIHLFYFRRYRKVLFSNVRFLREVKEETSARNRLRNLLILLMRLLAIAALVFAFAQPFIPISDSVKVGTRHVSIFVDNSFSMSSFGQELPLLDQAKNRAREILEAYGAEDRFQVLTHALTSGQQRFINKEEALTRIEDIEIEPEVAMLSKVVDRATQLFQNEQSSNNLVYLISDFQKSIWDISQERDTTFELNLVPVQAVQEQNVTIDSCWFEAPVQMLNQTNNLVIRITNHGSDIAENIKLSMDVDGQERPVSALEIPAGETVTDTASITILKTGWHRVTLRISDFPVQFDDDYFLSFYVDEDVRILSINQNRNNRNLEAVFQASGYFSLDNQSLNNLNFSTFGNYELIILNEIQSISSGIAEELKKYLDVGGKVILFPTPDVDPASYNTFLDGVGANRFTSYEKKERKVSYINTDEFIFKDVFDNLQRNLRLPTTQGNFGMTRFQGRATETILGYRDGTAFLSKNSYGNGSFYVSGAGLSTDQSDLVRNAEVFVPMLYKISIARNEAQPVAYTVGKSELIEIETEETGTERVYRFRGEEEFIPVMIPLGSKMLLDTKDQVSTAGFYQLILNEEIRGVYAFNYDRKESALSHYSSNEIRELAPDGTSLWDNVARAGLSRAIGEKDKGIILWKWCIIFALLFLAIEILLIRLWKT